MFLIISDQLNAFTLNVHNKNSLLKEEQERKAQGGSRRVWKNL